MTDYRMLIGGELTEGDRILEVVNPATGAVFATAAAASHDQAMTAVAAAKAAFPGWSATPATERRALVCRLADNIKENAELIARLLTQEQGKPLAEAQAEILYAELFLRHFASIPLDPDVVQDDDSYRIEVRYKPLGPVLGIAPWNLPVLIGLNKIAPALVAGNTVVLKAAPTTPLTSLCIGQLAAEIFPAGVVNFITDHNDLGGALTSHPDFAKISFTGSTATGRKVAASAASGLKRLTLELGGNDAAIVLDDADVSKIAERVFGATVMNCGQVCIAVKRLYVPDSLYDDMCDALAAIAESATVGDGLDEATGVGPLQNAAQFEKAKGYLDIAHADGKVIAGGSELKCDGYFIRPTIVRDIEDGSRLVDEEQFAPILPVVRYSDLDEAVKRANTSEYGLGGSVWSSNSARAVDVASRIDSGTVWVNHHLHFGPHIPFGGAKDSGVGVEFGRDGMVEFTQRSVISVAHA